MSKNDLSADIENIKKINSFSFARNTTYACGGCAEIAYFPTSINQATAVYDYLSANSKNFIILGNGTNVLASDNNYDGAVISTKCLCGITRLSEGKIFCLAGTKVSELMKFCLEQGLSGLEYLAGIPATVGGLALMNGGAAGLYIGNSILNVRLYNGSICNFTNKKCKFGYKYSIMRDINALILGVELKVDTQNSENVRNNISMYLERRKFHPKGASCGCVFKNVGSLSAGKLIDDCGLKGLRCGGAYVSPKHANFFINDGGSASDVYSLICAVKREVFKQTGIMLEEEVVYIGDF